MHLFSRHPLLLQSLCLDYYFQIFSHFSLVPQDSDGSTSFLMYRCFKLVTILRANITIMESGVR